MSYAKGTTHYNLPLTEGSDKRDWFDTNEPYTQIDAALHTAVEDTDTLKSEVATLQSDMTEAQTDIKDIKAYDAQNDVKVSALQTLTAQHTVDIEDVRQDAEDMICAIEEGSATASYAHAVGEYFRYNDTLYLTTVPIYVGDTIVPDINCSTTDIISRLGNADEVSKLKTKVDEVETLVGRVETQVDEIETLVGRVETQVGVKDISSYGASITDAIANSNIKVLDGEIYKLSDGAWSKLYEKIDISLDSNDYFINKYTSAYRYGNIVFVHFSLASTQNLTSGTTIELNFNTPKLLIGGSSPSNTGASDFSVIGKETTFLFNIYKTFNSGSTFFSDVIYICE